MKGSNREGKIDDNTFAGGSSVGSGHWKYLKKLQGEKASKGVQKRKESLKHCLKVHLQIFW